jgi:hypothetical protein
LRLGRFGMIDCTAMKAGNPRPAALAPDQQILCGSEIARIGLERLSGSWLRFALTCAVLNHHDVETAGLESSQRRHVIVPRLLEADPGARSGSCPALAPAISSEIDPYSDTQHPQGPEYLQRSIFEHKVFWSLSSTSVQQ